MIADPVSRKDSVLLFLKRYYPRERKLEVRRLTTASNSVQMRLRSVSRDC